MDMAAHGSRVTTSGTDANGAMNESAPNASNLRWLSWKIGLRLTTSSSDPAATRAFGVEDRPGLDDADDLGVAITVFTLAVAKTCETADSGNLAMVPDHGLRAATCRSAAHNRMSTHRTCRW